MKAIQLSVFLENRTGRLNEVTKVLADAGVNMKAFCLAEAEDFGILRMVVDDVERGAAALKAAGVAVSRTEVVSLTCPNQAGELHKILDRLASHGVFIEYMYAFSEGDTAHTVIRPTNVAECLSLLE